MKIDDLVALTKAGYTKADIEALCINVEETPAPVEVETPAPAEEEKPAPVESDRMKEIETKLDYAINRLNYIGVQNSSQPAQPEESIEDILKSVLK